MFQLDIPEQYRALYGVNAEAFNVKQNGRSKLGSPYWKKDEFNRWHFMPVKLGDLDLWAPIVRIVGRTKVVETPMVERDGSVKELISLEDWLISIRGIIKRPDGSYPDTEQMMLRDMRAKKQALPIECAKTSIFLNGDEHVVILNMNFTDAPGQTEAVVYEIELVSDKPFELEIE